MGKRTYKTLATRKPRISEGNLGTLKWWLDDARDDPETPPRLSSLFDLVRKCIEELEHWRQDDKAEEMFAFVRHRMLHYRSPRSPSKLMSNSEAVTAAAIYWDIGERAVRKQLKKFEAHTMIKEGYRRPEFPGGERWPVDEAGHPKVTDQK